MNEIDIKQQIHMIINPHSGYGTNRHLLADFRREARKQGVRLLEYTTKAPRDATRHAAEIANDAHAVIVWGGDGTVNEVANGLIGSEAPILPCPVGTENLLARELKIPAKPSRILDVLRTGKSVSCDLGRINDAGFLLIVGIGFDGEVVHRLTATRKGHISHLSYFWPIWRTFWEHEFPHMRIDADGENVFDGRGLAFVGNISRYATGLRICRDAQLDDGMLDLVVFDCEHQSQLVLRAAQTVLRIHPERNGVIYRRFKHLSIDSEQTIPSEVDGDVGPDTPLNIRVAEHSVRLIVPREHSGKGFSQIHQGD